MVCQIAAKQIGSTCLKNFIPEQDMLLDKHHNQHFVELMWVLVEWRNYYHNYYMHHMQPTNKKIIKLSTKHDNDSKKHNMETYKCVNTQWGISGSHKLHANISASFLKLWVLLFLFPCPCHIYFSMGATLIFSPVHLFIILSFLVSPYIQCSIVIQQTSSNITV